MKGKMLPLTLALALCVQLTACAAPPDSAGGEAPADKGAPASAETTANTDSASPYGLLPDPEPGSFYTGATVVFSDGAYTAFGDGIYYIEGDAPVQVVEDDIIFDSVICTDGHIVYYVNAYGELMEADLSDGSTRQITNGASLPYHTGVVGAGRDRVYLEVPPQYEEEDDVNGVGELSDVSALSLETGETLDTWDWFGGAGCAGGYTAIFGQGFDVSPRQLYIFDYDGGAVVDEPFAMSASVSGGCLWYGDAGLEEDGVAGAPTTLYRIDPEGPTPVLDKKVEEGYFHYGFSVGGYLASLYYSDANGDVRVDHWDLRTMEPATDLDDQFWSGGYVVDGREYLLSSERVFRVTEDGREAIFEIPASLTEGVLSLCGDYVLLDARDGEFYAFPLNDDAVVHPIPVTAMEASLELYDGKNGATVTGWYPMLITEGTYFWEDLGDAMQTYNEEARQRTVDNAEECVALASSLVEDGFASPEDPFSVSTRAYIQRADTLAFSFVEHQTMDNRVNRGALDIRTGFNYTPDGEVLTLDQIVTDWDGLREALADQLEETGLANRESFAAYLEDLFAVETLNSSPEFSWVLGYEGLSFYFNAHVNFPYGSQSCKCYLSFTGYEDLFDDRWFAVPDSYACDILLDDYFNEEYQLEYYGGTETLLPMLSREDDGDQGSLHAVINGEDASLSFYGRPVYATLVHYCDNDYLPRTGGYNYLLVQYCGDSMSLEIYTVDDQFREFFDFGQGALPQHMPYEEGNYNGPAHAWFGDPSRFAVLRDDGVSGYDNRCLYDFSYGTPRLLDLTGASLAVG